MAIKCTRIGHILHYKTPLKATVVAWARRKGSKDCIIDMQTAYKPYVKIYAGIEPGASKKEIAEALEMYANGVCLSQVTDLSVDERESIKNIMNM